MADEAFRLLAAAVTTADAGHEAGACPDGYRAHVYYDAIDRPEAHEVLWAALCAETDRGLVGEVVVGALERVPPSDAARWLGLIDPSSSRYEYAVRRAAELAVLEAVTTRGARPALSPVSEWSDWLQRRAAEQAASEDVMRALAESGRTRRVRAVAVERLRRIGGGGR